MKKLYLTWNREAVNDETIFNDIKKISKGRLVVKDGLSLIETKDFIKNNPHQKKSIKKPKRFHSNHSNRSNYSSNPHR